LTLQSEASGFGSNASKNRKQKKESEEGDHFACHTPYNIGNTNLAQRPTPAPFNIQSEASGSGSNNSKKGKQKKESEEGDEEDESPRRVTDEIDECVEVLAHHWVDFLGAPACPLLAQVRLQYIY